MSRRESYHIDARLIVPPDVVETVRAVSTQSGRVVWITPQDRLRVHTLRGVPGKLLDLLLPEAGRMPAEPVALEIGRKAGSYDGAVRWRLTFRPWRGALHQPGKPSSIQHPSPGRLAVEEEADALVLLARWEGGIWAQSFAQLRYVVHDKTPRDGIFVHHWQTYYSFLPEEDVRQTCALWAALPAVQSATDIVQLNRMAGTALYDLARSLGWRKLTLRERRRYGLTEDSPCWHRADALVLRQVDERAGSPTGAGQYTLRAAAPRFICPQCHGLSGQCACA